MFNQFLRSEPFTDAINDMKEEDEYGNRLQQDVVEANECLGA